MEKDKERSEIEKKYLTPGSKLGYSSFTSFLRNSKFKNINKIDNTLSSLRTYSIHKPIRSKYIRRKEIVNWIDDKWTLDIAVMLKYKFSNSHFGYFLVIQDIFSKFIWTFPLKKQDSTNVVDAFQKLF
jgi:hypothetical protein